MNFNQFALSKFENYVKRNDKYLDIRKKLRSARIFRPYEEYVSYAILFSLVVAVIGLIIGVLIGIIVVTRVHIPTLVFANEGVANFFNIFSPYKKYTTVAIISGTFFLMLGGMVYSAFMIYPSIQSSIRKVKIDTMLPHAFMYMYSLSRGDINIVGIIKAVAEFPNIYGEVSNEFAMALRDMELLGIDFMQALRNVQKETPSQNLNEFLGNLITIVDNGGDVTDFFSVQIENYRITKKSEHTLFLDLLGMIAEGYVTGFVAGPLFIIIVGVTLGSMKSSMTLLLIGMTYVVIPLGSIAFIFLIDAMLPKDEQDVGELKLHRVKEFSGIRTRNIENEKEKNSEKKLFKEYGESKKRIKLENILKDPLHAFFEEPTLSLYLSIPIATLVILIPIFYNYKIFFTGYVAASEYITNYILLGVLIATVPYIIFFETRHRKLWKVESSIPQFLKHLSIVNETGLSLAESLRVMLRTERGALRTYIERMYTDISWGASTIDAFTRFANKIRVSSLSRLVALITKASETSGDIRQVLEIASTDSNMNIQLRKDKSTNMLIYVIIIYISFLVFLYIIYTLMSTFLPQMAKAAEQAGGTMFIKNFSLSFNRVYFYHTVLIQGFFSGIMAGVLGEGDYRSGLKHSIIMMSVAFILFRLFV